MGRLLWVLFGGVSYLIFLVSRPVDSDHDGVPARWEKKHGFDPHDPSDRNERTEEGYTMLEKYLNSLVP